MIIEELKQKNKVENNVKYQKWDIAYLNNGTHWVAKSNDYKKFLWYINTLYKISSKNRKYGT